MLLAQGLLFDNSWFREAVKPNALELAWLSVILHLLLPVQPWANDLPFVFLNMFICKIKTVRVAGSRGLRIK